MTRDDDATELGLARRLGMGLLVAPFWVSGYMLIERLTLDRARHAVATPLDDLVPFVPLAAMIYPVTYVQFLVPICLNRTRRDFGRLLVAFLVLTAGAFLTYLAIPTLGPPRPVPPDSWLGRIMAWIYEVDAPLNCFPSLHCACAALVFLTTPRDSAFRPAMFLLSAGVCLSTILVRQHWLLCIPGGITLAWLAWRVARALLPGRDGA